MKYLCLVYSDEKKLDAAVGARQDHRRGARAAAGARFQRLNERCRARVCSLSADLHRTKRWTRQVWPMLLSVTHGMPCRKRRYAAVKDRRQA